MDNPLIDIYRIKLNRLIVIRDRMENNNTGRESILTYWDGFELGLIKGQINEIETIIDVLSPEQAI